MQHRSARCPALPFQATRDPDENTTSLRSRPTFCDSEKGNDVCAKTQREQRRHAGRLLPAIGVGAAIYLITGVASLSTLGLVGIGAGVGYGVGSWIADKMQKKENQNKVPLDQLPWAVQVALQHWQEFLTRQAGGRQLTPADVDAIWAQFEQYEPAHAAKARALVRGSAPGASNGSSQGASSSTPGGPTFVAMQAAEV
eukprot:g30791.t1